MATSSFDRAFTVKDTKAADVLLNELQHGQHVTIKRRDIEAESKKGAQLLARRLRSA
ncbi:MAG: hypothetical protein VW625_05845 [Perlucidibaca sp.]